MKRILTCTFLSLITLATTALKSDIKSTDAAGLKEALKVGTNLAVSKLNVTDGYLGNALVKILLPPEAQQIQKYAGSLGLGDKLFKDAMVSMNRAAEKAAKDAKPIFVNAITGITIQDATGILFSSDHGSATKYLKTKTYTNLEGLYKPQIKSSLNSVGATALWGQIVNPYNHFASTFAGKFAGAKTVNPNLEEYVTRKALDGLFLMISKEEKNIRENPAARVTDILKQVFGKVMK